MVSWEEYLTEAITIFRKEFKKHKSKAFEIWEKRSKHQWKQDVGKYKEFIKQ